MNTTDLFIQDIMAFSKREFPISILNQVKYTMIDYIGATLAGAKETEAQFKNFLEEEKGQFYPVGVDEPTSLLRAVFLNGYNSHVLEMDDGHRFGMLHLSATIYSAMLVIAQKEKLDFQHFSKGVIVGFEVATRLAMAVQPSHKQKGYHATGTCGVCGVAMAIGVALDFDLQEMKNALSAAATSAGALLEVIVGKSQMKPYNIANAVQNGVMAAYFGKADFCGPDDILGGERGFLSVLADEIDISKLKILDQDRYCIKQIYMKPYAACRHCHAPIEGALSIAKKFEIDYREIDSVVINTYKLAVYGHDHSDITGMNSAKMSIPYSVAVALVSKSANIEDFKGVNLHNDDILELCKKVKTYENKEFTAISPGIRGAHVKVILKNGRTYEERVDYAKGEPENPIELNELKEKYFTLAMHGGKTEEETRQILEKINNIENEFDALYRI